MANRASENRAKGTYCLVTLGCPKNLVDSERMLGLLQEDGYRLVADPDGADFAVVNTCGFLQSARQESLDVIHEMAQLKEQGRLGGLIVAGCLAERDKQSLIERCPSVDQLLGVFAREEVAAAADRLVGGLDEQRTAFRPAPSRPLSDANRLRVTPKHLAYLKIAEGCDRRCTFCSIPSIRGPQVSKPIEQVVDEAEQLAGDGARELILVAQDTTSYGLDTDGRPRLADLLARLVEIDGVEWVRLMYLYPMHITDELVELVASSPKILPYLDLPLQHASDSVLGRMGRRVGRRETDALIDRLRRRIEHLVLRTTMLVGFPGETEEQFEELVEFVRSRRFERLGVFAFSPESGTAAARLPDQVPEPVRQSRRDRLMEAQQEIAFRWNESQVGRQWEVIIDRDIPGEKDAWVGRGPADAPEIDGVVYVTGQRLAAGKIVPCEIVATGDYDLIGAAVGKPR